jgi:CubicO group peptidase (beta-lactamase class C family)
MQMYLNGGHYGGNRFFSSSTLKNFTSRHNRSSRRGIGFDMKELDESRSKVTCSEASASTFGHTGFTGTCAFVDPEYNLVYVFLSNRTYPEMNNNALNKKDFREKVQACIYNAIVQDL